MRTELKKYNTFGGTNQDSFQFKKSAVHRAQDDAMLYGIKVHFFQISLSSINSTKNDNNNAKTSKSTCEGFSNLQAIATYFIFLFLAHSLSFCIFFVLLFGLCTSALISTRMYILPLGNYFRYITLRNVL